MRTTLTIDDDIAAELERLRKSRDLSLKTLINEALRLGLREIDHPPKPRERFTTNSVDLGECLVGSIDNIGEVLAIIEGEAYK